MIRQSSYRHITEPAIYEDGAVGKCEAVSRNLLGISVGGGGGVMMILSLFSRIFVVSAIFAGFLTLNPLQVRADDECDEAAEIDSEKVAKVVVTCSNSNPLSDYEANRLRSFTEVVNYDVTSASTFIPSDAKRLESLKVILEEDVTINGLGGEVIHSGLKVNNNFAKTIEILSDADISAGHGILVESIDDRYRKININVRSGNFSITQFDGVKVGAKQADIDIDFVGTVTVPAIYALPGRSGVHVYRSSSDRGKIDIDLNEGAEIGIEEKGLGINYGIYVFDEYAPTSSTADSIIQLIKINTAKGTSMGSEDTPLNLHGIYTWIKYNRITREKKDVFVTHKGKIYSKGNGIKIVHDTDDDPNNDNGNNNGGKGTATVVIEDEGVVVSTGDLTHGNYGIYLDTPDLDSSGKRMQSVVVYGKVFGKSDGGSAIHLKGGGTVTIGRNAMLMPSGANDSYRTIKVTGADPVGSGKHNLVVRLDRNFNGIKNIENAKANTAFQYRTTDSGEYADLPIDQKITLTITLDSQVPCGFYNDCLATKTDEIT